MLTEEEYEELCELANWLQPKSVEDRSYWKWHIAAQKFLMKAESAQKFSKSYYDDYFFPYIVVRGHPSNGTKKMTSKDFEDEFPRDYEATLEKWKQILEGES